MLMLCHHLWLFDCWKGTEDRKKNESASILWFAILSVTNWIALFRPLGKFLLTNTNTNKIYYTSNSINSVYNIFMVTVISNQITYIYLFICLFVMKDSWIDVNVNSFCFIKSKYWCWLWGILWKLHTAISKSHFFVKYRGK